MPQTCRAIEEQFGDKGCKCIKFRESFPNCECEMHSVSMHSPEPVSDEEQIARTFYSPIQINLETREPTPAAFSDAKDKGLSVDRITLITKEELDRKNKDKIARDKASGKIRDDSYYLAVANCGEIRRRTLDDDGNTRLFCIYDTAKENAPSHADVCQGFEYPEKHAGKKKLSKKIRGQLQAVFSDALTIQEAFPTSD